MLKLLILPLAASAFFLSSGISATDLDELNLDEGYSEAFFGDGWYGDLGLRGNCLCAENPTLPFCITALDAPVLEVPGFGGSWGGYGGRHHHRGYRGPRTF